MKQSKLTILLLLFPMLSIAQGQYTNEIETRIGASIEKEFFNCFEISFSPSIRLGNDFSYNKTLLDLDLGYDVMGWFKIGAGGRIVFNDTKEITSRLDGEISKSIKIKRFSIKPRIRYSHYFNIQNNDEAPNSNILRYKVDCGYKHSKNALFRPKIGIELFHTLNNNIIDAIRYSVGGSFHIAKHHSISIEYVLDNDFNNNNNRHIVELGYKLKL